MDFRPELNKEDKQFIIKDINDCYGVCNIQHVTICDLTCPSESRMTVDFCKSIDGGVPWITKYTHIYKYDKKSKMFSVKCYEYDCITYDKDRQLNLSPTHTMFKILLDTCGKIDLMIHYPIKYEDLK